MVPVGERAADAGRVVAGGAVGPEEVAALDDVRGGDVDGGDGRARSERGDVRHQCLDLVVAVGGWLATACSPITANGMRPVRSWKSAAAAPTPTNDGTWSDPVASSPWQDEHPVW